MKANEKIISGMLGVRDAFLHNSSSLTYDAKLQKGEFIFAVAKRVLACHKAPPG